jgi:hypothetical protein
MPMKVLCFTLAFLPCFAFSQDTIQSELLDRMIWQKINDYRASLNIPRATIFERGLMRAFSRRVTNGNALSGISVHSDSVGYFCNTECLFSLVSKGNTPNQFTLVDNLRKGDFRYLADEAVKGWQNSPSHNRLIKGPDYTISTVTTMIIISPLDKGYSVRFEASHHSLSNHIGATFTDDMDAYVAALIKRGY